MPEPRHAGAAIVHPDSVELDVLRRLAGKSTYVVRTGAQGEACADFTVLSSRYGGQSLASISPQVIVRMCRHGWLEADQRAGHYRIAAAGKAVLRRVLSTPLDRMLPAHSKSRHERKAKSKAAHSLGGPRQGSLAWLRRRRDKSGLPLISEPQFSAAERLSADFWRAQLNPRVTANWSATAPGRREPRSAPGLGVELGDHVVAARQRVHRALEAVGSELAGILVDVCCHDIGLEDAGRAKGWPQRAAKVVLQLALTGLARHYGLIAPDPRIGATRFRHWGSDDYRPDIEAWR